MFNQNIGKLKVDVNDLTKLYENQVKIQIDIQKLIETNNRNTRIKIGKLDTKDIVVQKQIDEIVRTQNTFQQKLSDIVMTEEHDDDIGNTSDWVSQKSKQHKSCCCSRKIRWNLLIVFLAILTTSCLGSIGFSIYLMIQFQDLSVELEHAVLKNYTDMFNENIGKLKVDVKDLTKMHQNQVKIQRDIQKLIENNNNNTRLKIGKLDTKDIVVQKQIDEIVRTQNTFQQKLSDLLMAGSNTGIRKQKTNDSQWISYTLIQTTKMYTDKDDHEYPDRSEKLLNEKTRECVVDMKSNGGKQTKNPQGQICTCVWIKKWKWKVLFGIIAVCSIVSVALSLYKMANLSLDEKEISSMKKDILDMKQQRKKFENDIRLLYAGHYDQNDNLDTLETVLQNITVTFNERINNLTTELNTLNTEYERQVRLQKDMQKQIDTMGTENRKKFEEFNQKMIVMKQNLNNMTASQEVLKNDLRDAQSSMRRETQNAVDRIRNDFRAAQHKLESDYRETRNSQNELKASQQSLRSMVLGKLSVLKKHVQSKPNACPITRSSVGLIIVLLYPFRFCDWFLNSPGNFEMRLLMNVSAPCVTTELSKMKNMSYYT
ncbi:Hypothetical predicted protein, partial [Mytilus galloprovincialis]